MDGTVEDIAEVDPVAAAEAREREIEKAVEQIEGKVLSYFANAYSEAKGAMDHRLTKWALDEERYEAEKKELEDDEWFSKIDPPRGARIINLHIARMFAATVPDTHRLDFFRLTPESDQGEGTPPNEQDAAYAHLAEIAVRNDLINGKFLEDYKAALCDYFVFGNMYLMPVWELDIQWRYKQVPNPEHEKWLTDNAQMAQQMQAAGQEPVPFRMDIVDGVEVPTPIKATIRKREPVRQFDAPKLRHIRATNVMPMELDRKNAMNCTGVCIYDTVRLSDLREDEISTGGYNYANLDKLSLSDESTDIPEVPESAGTTPIRHYTNRVKAEIAKKMDHVTYLGRFRLDEVIEELDLNHLMDGDLGPEVIERLAVKFNWEREKLSNWNTWIVELVKDQTVMARWQPSPYERDKIPLVHKKYHGSTQRTLGKSVYDLIRDEEQARNKMLQLNLMHTQKVVEPPVMVIKDYVDPRWWNLQGGTLKYKRNMLIPGLKGASIQQTIQPMEFSQAPLQASHQAISTIDNQMDQSANLPAVQQGVTSGGQTATEISQMGASSDVMTDYMAKDTEAAFLEEGVDWMLILHHQYTEEPKLVNYYDDQGKLQFTQVPPEVWTHCYKVNLQGWESIGNREVRAMNFNEFMKTAQATGWANPEAMLMEAGKILQIRDPKRLIKAPEPQPPSATLSSSNSLALNHELLPAGVVAKLLKRDGVEITPEDEQQMREMERARAIREVSDQANVPIPLEAALPPSWAPPTAGLPAPMADPTANAADPEAVRNHHAPGELRPQGGLHDAKGLQNSMGKMLANPNNSRAATGL